MGRVISDYFSKKKYVYYYEKFTKKKRIKQFHEDPLPLNCSRLFWIIIPSVHPSK